MEQLQQHIQALIFAAAQPVTPGELQMVLEEVFQTPADPEVLKQAIAQLQAMFQQPEFAFELAEIAGGYQFLTKGAFHNTVAAHLRQHARKRLSQAAMETLAIVAYKQPVSKSELEEIRGVSCDYALQKLLERELVMISGRSESPGRPLLYGTTDRFMDYMGINALSDLPRPKDFKAVENAIGEEAPIDETAFEPNNNG